MGREAATSPPLLFITIRDSGESCGESSMFFKTRKENLRLRLQVLELTKRVDGLMDECGHQKDLNRGKEQTIVKLNQNLVEANKRIRAQTEADLLINALKALKIIPEEKPTKHFEEAGRLQDVLARQNAFAAQQSQRPLGLQGLLGGAASSLPFRL